MAGDKDQFFTLEMKDGGTVTFGDNGKGKIIGIGKIKITPFTFIENVLLVDKLKHNLLSISQLCDRGFKVLFESSMYIVSSSLDSCVQFIGHRLGNVYMVDLMLGNQVPVRKRGGGILKFFIRLIILIYYMLDHI